MPTHFFGPHTNSLNSGGRSSSLKSCSVKYILLILQVACTCICTVSLYRDEYHLCKNSSRLNWTWFHPGDNFKGIAVIFAFVLTLLWNVEALNLLLSFFESITCTSMLQGPPIFFIKNTRWGSVIPSDFNGPRFFFGHWTNVVATVGPRSSITELFKSSSIILSMAEEPKVPSSPATRILLHD